MKLSLKILDSNMVIQKAILDALLPEVSNFMNKANNYIQNNIYAIIRESIVSQPEYDSLVSGQLRLELGVPDAALRIEDLINIWINNAVVEYKSPKISNNKIKSSFSIKMIKTNFDDVLNLDVANIESDVASSGVPWLRWLLLDGTTVVVDDYEVYFGPNNRSRTGYAIMRASSDRGWSVPQQYAGTLSDNWITRGIESSKTDIQKLLEKALSQ